VCKIDHTLGKEEYGRRRNKRKKKLRIEYAARAGRGPARKEE
jgi:ribosomal protein S30|tara:strand:- start:32 stop:157 length:126 start_codon:yes stop_codon:yes gene_type:complete